MQDKTSAPLLKFTKHHFTVGSTIAVSREDFKNAPHVFITRLIDPIDQPPQLEAVIDKAWEDVKSIPGPVNCVVRLIDGTGDLLVTAEHGVATFLIKIEQVVGIIHRAHPDPKNRLVEKRQKADFRKLIKRLKVTGGRKDIPTFLAGKGFIPDPSIFSDSKSPYLKGQVVIAEDEAAHDRIFNRLLPISNPTKNDDWVKTMLDAKPAWDIQLITPELPSNPGRKEGLFKRTTAREADLYTHVVNPEKPVDGVPGVKMKIAKPRMITPDSDDIFDSLALPFRGLTPLDMSDSGARAIDPDLIPPISYDPNFKDKS